MLPPPRAQPEVYRVASPDQLVVVVLPDPPIERIVVVRPDGMISFDLVGDVAAEGRVVEEIAAEIERRIDPVKPGARVTVFVGEARSTEVTVLGEVSAPSTFVLPRETSLAQVIGMAGGLTAFAKKQEIRVIRRGEEVGHVYFVDFDTVEEGNLSANFTLEAGDVVIVPPTLFARIGYRVQQLLFPFMPLIAIGSTVAVYAGVR